MMLDDAREAIASYHATLGQMDREICQLLMETLEQRLVGATAKLWHGSPVWFLDGNPIAGYSKKAKGVQLLFWSGQSFGETALKPVGKFKAAEAMYAAVDEVERNQLNRWVDASIRIQWDYKNIVRNKGELELLP